MDKAEESQGLRIEMSTADNFKTVFESPAPPKDAKSAVAHLLVDLHSELGEGIIYDDVENALLWTDILGRKFQKLSLSPASGQEVQVFELPKMVGSFALRPSNEPGYLVAWENGFQLYDLEKGVALSEMSAGEEVNPFKLPTRLNDGRCDREGRRYICGGYFGELKEQRMKVFKCEFSSDGKLCHSPIQEDMRVTNSLSFSLDGSSMYLADSPTQTINIFKYDKETGAISDKRFVHKTPMGVPDGSCVDSEGFLWNAVWRSGAGQSMVNRINPNSGEIDFTVHMPDGTSQVTCCCFGGQDLDILFISTSAEGRDVSKEPHAGAVYAAKVGFKGLKEARFVGK